MVATITIPREELIEHGLPYDSDAGEGVEIISDTIVENTRWSIIHDLLFRWKDGKVYCTSYSVGATEYQYESPWEYEDVVACVEVREVEKLVKVWEPVE